MKSLESILLLIFLSILFISCVDSKDEEESKSSDHFRSRSVMQDDSTCVLPGNYRHTELQDIVGVWTDSLVWKTQPNDSCWYGIEELDIHLELRINEGKTFTWKRTCTNQEFNSIKQGEVFIYSDGQQTNLRLAINPLGEKVYAHGDTIWQSMNNDLLWTERNSIILITDIKKKGQLLKESTEFFRVND